MLILRTVLVAILAAMAGCVVGYTLVQPGINTAKDLQVYAGSGWNLAPATATYAARKESKTWTQDGLLLDRLVLVPAVPDGESLLIDRTETKALPVFRKDMLPNEIEELVESTLVDYFGEGNAAVSTENLRPQKFGDIQGFRFDILVQLTDSPDFRGSIGAFVADDKLYSIWYLAAEPHYHDKHFAKADEIIASARIATTSS